MKKILSLLLALGLMGGLVGIVFAGQQHKQYVCHYTGNDKFHTLYVNEETAYGHLGEHAKDYAGKCKEGDEPTATPSVSPEVTPTPEITETPTQNPCDLEVTLLVVTEEDQVPCVTPTPEPSETPTPEVKTEQALTPAGVPQCNDDSKLQYAPTVTYAWRTGTDLQVKWTSGNTEDYLIYFTPTGQSDYPWNTGRLQGIGEPLDFTIHNVNQMVDVKVCSVSKCGQEMCSARFIDP